MFGVIPINELVAEVGDEYPTAVIAPLLLFIYSFLVMVVLLNLLIAQMSETFGRITSEGERRWLIDRGNLILEFKDKKEPLPPPLNILWMLFAYLPRAIQRCQRAGAQQIPNTGFK